MRSCGYFLFVAVLCVNATAVASTFTVNSTADPGDGVCNVEECTLREAILAADLSAGSDVVEFAIPGTPPFTIAPQSNLPEITDDILIDGFSQPGASPNTLPIGDNAVIAIEIDGGNVRTVGLQVVAGSADLRGLAIGRFTTDGISIYTDGNVVRGCRVGADVTGTLPRGNNRGLTIYGKSSNRIGGSAPADRNVVSANAREGVYLLRSVTRANEVPTFPNDNTIEGNLIGVAASGSDSLGNGGNGISIKEGSRNIIRSNVASGNGAYGIAVGGTFEENIGLASIGAAENLIVGNKVGTDANGLIALPNADGITIFGLALSNVIGGSATGDQNVISGNASNGIVLQSAEVVSDRWVHGTVIDGNIIGGNSTGNAALPNGGAGILAMGGLSSSIGSSIGNVIVSNGSDGIALAATPAGGIRSSSNTIRKNLIGRGNGGGALGNGGAGIRLETGDFGGGDGNLIGDVDAALGNVIENNAAGVIVEAGRGNAILGNSIDTNAGLGIDLGGDGVTPNDPLDADDGANRLQNFPLLTGAISTNGSVIVSGQLESTPSTSFTIQIFGVTSPSQLLASFSVTTDANGVVTFSAPLASSPATSFIATATDNGTLDTSEFSAPVSISAAAAIPSLSHLVLLILAGFLALIAALRMPRA